MDPDLDLDLCSVQNSLCCFNLELAFQVSLPNLFPCAFGTSPFGTCQSQMEVSSGSDMRMLDNAIYAMVGNSPQSRHRGGGGGGGGGVSRLVNGAAGDGRPRSRPQSPVAL